MYVGQDPLFESNLPRYDPSSPLVQLTLTTGLTMLMESHVDREGKVDTR